MSLKLNKEEKETYQTFYERLCHHQRTHLAPRGSVGTGPANLVNDALTLSHQNLVTMLWMQKIDKRLPGLVALEFAAELQSGTQITALVHRISKRADTLLNNTAQATASLNLVTNEAVQDNHVNETAAAVDAINKINFGKNYRPQTDGQNWRNSRSNIPKPSGIQSGQRTQFSTSTQRQGSPFCPGCQYLGSQLKLQVRFDHLPGNCPRKDGVVKLIQAEQLNEDQEDQDVNEIMNEINKDTSSYLVFPSNDPLSRTRLLKIYQQSHILSSYNTFPVNSSPNQSTCYGDEFVTDPPQNIIPPKNLIDAATETSIHNEKVETAPIVTKEIIEEKQVFLQESSRPSWYECTKAKITRLKSRSKVRKEKSPSLIVSLQNATTTATIDEGAELNCIDEDFCLRNDIKFEKTSETATAAGKNCMILSGETCESVFLRPQQNQNVRWNLGKCVAVKNLGCDILIGEPAKKDNCIVTIAHKQRIFTPDVNGLEVNLDYATKSSICNIKSTSSYLCRVNEPKFLLPDEKFEFALPEHFSNADVVIAPRKLFEDSFVWPKPQLLKVISNKILIPNDTGRSITLKKSDHFADITVLKNVDKAQDTVKKVYDLDRSDLSHLILPDRPELDQHQSYIADIKVDPDGQLTEDWKLKFKRLCEKFSHIINPAPGKYNGYYGRVDNSLHFISTPAPVKARLPNYSHDKMMIQAREMDKMEKYGVLSTPEELGIVPLHVVPSMLVPKSEPGEYRVVSDFNSLNVHLKKPEVVLQTMEEIKRVLGSEFTQ